MKSKGKSDPNNNLSLILAKLHIRNIEDNIKNIKNQLIESQKLSRFHFNFGMGIIAISIGSAIGIAAPDRIILGFSNKLWSMIIIVVGLAILRHAKIHYTPDHFRIRLANAGTALVISGMVLTAIITQGVFQIPDFPSIGGWLIVILGIFFWLFSQRLKWALSRNKSS